MALFEERYARSRLAAVCTVCCRSGDCSQLLTLELQTASPQQQLCSTLLLWGPLRPAEQTHWLHCTGCNSAVSDTKLSIVAGHDTMQNTAGRVKTFETLWGELRMKFVAYRIGFNSTLSFKDSYQDTSWCMHQVINIQYTKHRDEGVAEIRCQFII